ncbi:hypothetical protein SATRM34S_06821 [Streptomyces atroolivaceus]
MRRGYDGEPFPARRVAGNLRVHVMFAKSVRSHGRSDLRTGMVGERGERGERGEDGEDGDPA